MEGLGLLLVLVGVLVIYTTYTGTTGQFVKVLFS